MPSIIGLGARRPGVVSPDANYFLRNNNPFTHVDRGNEGSPATQVADSFAKLGAGLQWDNQQRANAGGINAVAGGGLGVLPGGGLNSPGSADLLRTNKNADIQNTLNGFLGQLRGLNPGQTDYSVNTSVKNATTQGQINKAQNDVSGLNYDPNTNPYTLRSNVKDQGIANQLSNQLGTFATDKTANRADLDKFTNNLTNTDGSAKANTDQETKAVAGFYGDESDPSSVLGKLKNIAERTSAGVHAASTRALQAAQRNANLGIMDKGLGSYASQQVMDTAGGLAANEAVRRGDLDRNNYLYTLEGQKGLLGARNKLLNDYASRSLMPIDARTRLGASEQSQLGTLGQISNNNTQYTMDSPDMAMARKLGLMGQVQGMDETNKFNTLESPEQIIQRRMGLLGSMGALDQQNNFYGLGGGFPNYRGPGVNPYPQTPEPLQNPYPLPNYNDPRLSGPPTSPADNTPEWIRNQRSNYGKPQYYPPGLNNYNPLKPLQPNEGDFNYNDTIPGLV